MKSLTIFVFKMSKFISNWLKNANCTQLKATVQQKAQSLPWWPWGQSRGWGGWGVILLTREEVAVLEGGQRFHFADESY